MATVETRRVQTAYDASFVDPMVESDEERLIESAMLRYLANDLGLSDQDAQARAQRELAGDIGRDVCNELAEMGIAIDGKRVLDLGAGMGGICTELARRGAVVVGLEPGKGWCDLAARRLRAAGSGAMVQAVGEAVPLASESVDVIVSHQVLEHVQSPEQVIAEAWRVLKPGGYFYFSYANYFSFFEQHYRVFWLPLMPKWMGSAYLRLRGRDPQFLMESVTYTTFHGVRRLLAKVGFGCMRRAKSAHLLQSAEIQSLKWRVARRLPASVALDVISAVDYGKRVMIDSIYECVRKPA